MSSSVAVEPAAGEDGVDAVGERGDLVAQQPGREYAQQVLGGEQGVEFGIAEPQAGELEGVLAVAGVVAPAAGLAVVAQGRLVVVAQGGDEAADGGFGAADLGYDGGQGQGGAAAGQEPVELIKAFELVHHFSRRVESATNGGCRHYRILKSDANMTQSQRSISHAWVGVRR